MKPESKKQMYIMYLEGRVYGKGPMDYMEELADDLRLTYGLHGLPVPPYRIEPSSRKSDIKFNL